MKKILLVAVLVIIFTAGVLLWQGSAAKSSPGPAVDHTVELRDDGYYPKDIVVQKGDVVKFITTRDKHFWPASNLHPAHTIYSEFDPKEPIGAGETWSFRFDEVGNWKYHDHLAPYFTGTIRVEE